MGSYKIYLCKPVVVVLVRVYHAFTYHFAIYNHRQNMWQKMPFYSPPPNINVVSGKTVFLPKDFINNSNIDVGGGKRVPKILYKVDMCARDGK